MGPKSEHVEKPLVFVCSLRAKDAKSKQKVRTVMWAGPVSTSKK